MPWIWVRVYMCFCCPHLPLGFVFFSSSRNVQVPFKSQSISICLHEKALVWIQRKESLRVRKRYKCGTKARMYRNRRAFRLKALLQAGNGCRSHVGKDNKGISRKPRVWHRRNCCAQSTSLCFSMWSGSWIQKEQLCNSPSLPETSRLRNVGTLNHCIIFLITLFLSPLCFSTMDGKNATGKQKRVGT